MLHILFNKIVWWMNITWEVIYVCQFVFYSYISPLICFKLVNYDSYNWIIMLFKTLWFMLCRIHDQKFPNHIHFFRAISITNYWCKRVSKSPTQILFFANCVFLTRKGIAVKPTKMEPVYNKKKLVLSLHFNGPVGKIQL